MEFSEYQAEAQRTDQTSSDPKKRMVVPLLGLAGEAGALLSQYKKYLRDGTTQQLMKKQVAEELGDILWYLANIATKFDLNLDKIAVENLAKTIDRWPPDRTQGELFAPF